MKAVFLDRDGTITIGTPTYERIDSVDKVELLPDSLEALRLLAELDYGVIIVTNQAGLGEGLITVDEFHVINNKILELIEPSGIKILKTYFRPRSKDDTSNTQKPNPAMLLEAAAEFDIDLQNSWIIGDRPTDVDTGVNAGTKTILVKSGDPNVSSDKATYTANDLIEAIQYIAKS